MMNRDNPVWLITGCSTGFGRELAKLVLERGWRAVVTARDPSKVKDIVEGHADRALVLPLDVTNPKQIEDVVTQTKQRFGRVDALVNNAGYGYLAAIEEGEDDEVRAMFETNVFGLVDLTKAVLPIMREQHSGLIVNVSSIAASTGYSGLSVYGATKASLVGFTRALARELGRRGVTVNAIAPGFVDTDMTQGMDEEERSRLARRSALKRLPDVEDVANGVAYLLGDAAKNVTGTVLTVDAGATA